VTNCLNFANPERPEIMAQFTGCLEGMADACRALDFPIVSGNVSLYNESKATGGGSAILPTPAIGGVGVIDDLSKMMTIGFKGEGLDIWLIGFCHGHLGRSLWLRECQGREEGDAPPINPDKERWRGAAVRTLIERGAVSAVHDISDGGMAVALAEMALAGKIGATISTNAGRDHHEAMTAAELWFGEDQSRYIVVATPGIDIGQVDFEDENMMRCSHRVHLGKTGGDALALDGAIIPLADLGAAHDSFFKDWMAG
jgi:phosphoribosylformylglycinamidine synthase